MPDVVSHCCSANIVLGSIKEYPLGGKVWYERFLIDVCDECGKECDAVMVCSYCGAEATSESPTFLYEGEERCYGCFDKEGEQDAESRYDAALQPKQV